MPTYELTCRTCGTRFERFLARMLKDEDKVCPSCGSTDVGQGVGGGYVSRSPRTAPPAKGCPAHGGIG